MAKEIISLKNLAGGINTFANPRVVAESELIIGDNVDTSVQGTLKLVGGFDAYTDVSSKTVVKDDVITQGGYGLHSFKVDQHLVSPDTAGEFSVIACFENIGASPRIGFLQENSDGTFTSQPSLISLTSDGIQRNTNDTDAGEASTNTQIQYLVSDGELVIYGGVPGGLNNTGSFDPQVLKFFPSGQKFFVNSGNLDAIEITANTYSQRKFFVEAPSGGHTLKSSGATVPSILGTTGYNYGINDDMVLLVIQEYNQTDDTHVGWGKTNTDSENYNFYASYIYDGTTESMATLIGNKNMGGHGSPAGGQYNDATFYAVVRARANGTSGAAQWDKQITAVSIYYAKSSQDQEIKYHIGEFPVRSYSDSDYVCEEVSTNDGSPFAGYALLYGDKNGKGSASYVGKGTYHYEPPRIFTHATNSGIRPNTKSTELKFKTGVILNRRLYVGNISQVTSESPTTKKYYPDRLLKSVSNKMRVMPDTEFVDVAIRDGEDIIRLAGIGNMLLQYKQNTLYIISVAGGEEYLAGTYKNMGVRHPNAVTQFEGGVFWVNEFGAFIFGGNDAPTNLVENKINLEEWKNFINNNTITGYDASTKKLWVLGNSSTILDDSGTNPEPVEFYTMNLLTRSWNKHIKTLGEGSYVNGVYVETDGGFNGVSNFINHVKPNGEQRFLLQTGKGTAASSSKLVVYNQDKNFMIPFKIATKEFTAGTGHQRKSIYALYITYKGTMTGDNNTTGVDYVIPLVKLVCQNAGNTTTTTTLEPKAAGLGFTNAPDWETAHYVVPQSLKANTRNAYSMQIVIEPGADSEVINNDFYISTISIILRLKSVK